MKNLLMCLAMLAAGCGGSDFSAEPLFGAGGNGSGGETQATNTGGHTEATGGDDAGIVGTGGLPGETGGAPADDSGAQGNTGGSGTGGETSTGTGGVPLATGGSTGGAVSTGGVAATGGTTGCALVTHDNGLGQTWQDCVALGTYDQTQAMKACTAWAAVNGGYTCSVGTFCLDNAQRAYAYTGTFFMTWAWQGTKAGDTIQDFSGNCTPVGTWN